MELVYMFIIISVILLGCGFYKLFYYNYAIKNYKQCEGVIVDYTAEDNYNPETGGFDRSFRPLVSYTINGKTYKKDGYKASAFEGSSRKNIGKKVILYYDDKDPQKVVFLKDNGIPRIILGLIFLIIPVIVLFNR